MTRRVRFSIGVGLLAVSTVAVLVGINLDLFLEAWHLRQLASDDEATLGAARRSLVALRSARAVPVLLERASEHSGAQLGGDAGGTLAGLRRARRDPSESVRFWAGIALRNLGEIETEELFSAETE